MIVWLGIVVTGIVLRQGDRWWYARHRPHAAGLRTLMELQRHRSNNLTPALLLAGQWLSIVGWWGVAATGGVAGWIVAALAVAVQLRHLQEISHFAVHGVLTRTARFGNLLAELAVHHPLGLVPVPVRRRRHVRDHHPNAARPGVDPNLTELHTAGLRPGVGPVRFARALVYPLTLRGIVATVVGIGTNLVPRPGSYTRAAAVAVVLAAAFALGGWQAVVFGVLVPRLLLYPQLAWMSLLVEHTWFDPAVVTGPPAAVEAGRCLRLYPRNRALAALAAGTWLPYGDLHHYAHSAHPAVRWNYLPALELHLGHPHFTPAGLLFTPSAVLTRHRRALWAPAGAGGLDLATRAVVTATV
ncbi:fatty acid desaturase [Streptomyces sp. 846.5]|nr:fatty acid desaturase [Streptomyces sp. 846.5]TDT93328.1 fatty acid desaturase [Streptomyces sp. 846.5]